MSENLKEKIEALLFATQGLSAEQICDKLKAGKQAVDKALNELVSDYDSRTSAFLVAKQGDLWKLTVKSSHVQLVKDLIPSEFPKSILETLAVIAWKNPALQSTIIKIRGNKAYDHIKLLERRELIKIRKKGKTNELILSDKFYEYFNTTKEEIKNMIPPA